MAAHTEGMERFKNAIFKQREEINDRMAEMFGLLKELTTSRAPEKEEKNEEDNVTTGDSIEKTSGSDPEMPVKEADKDTEAKYGAKNEPIKRAKREEAVE
ncbi:hypothetical protein Tco_1148424, partial [Tanacetum coccineum]